MDKLKALWAKIKQAWLDLWDKEKGIIILVALLAIIVKYRDILISILVKSGQREEKSAEKKDEKLSDQETQANNQANALIDQAKKEADKEKPVTDDWNKNS